MTQPPSSPPPGDGQYMPNGRPRQGAAPTGPVQGAPSFQTQPQHVDYGLPRLYDTSVRPASGLTRQRYAPAGIQAPQQAQPSSAWATQSRRVQDVSGQKSHAPASQIAAWIIAVLLGLLLVFILTGAFLLVVLGGEVNPAYGLVYGTIALLSLLVITGVIVLADRWDPQPLPLLLIAVFWGAAIAVSISFVLNTLFGMVVFSATGDSSIADFAGSVFSAPIVEETSKGLGLVLLALLARRAFNGPLDGLVYGALIGGGFAFVENILYYMRVAEAGLGFTDSIPMIIVRGVIGIFGHSIYCSLTGVIMGLVLRKWGTVPGIISFLVATWPGMFLHAFWNGGVTLLPAMLDVAGLIIMLALQFCMSAIWLGLIGYLVWDESRLTRVRLGDYANQGWLTHAEVDLLATWKGRREGRRWAKSFNAGPLMKRFIRDSAALASNRQRLLADGASPKAVAEERRLLDRLTANRQELAARSA
ncbi:PrsW family intramembrane metalloprotease [Brachybacterium sp. AOP25-B2-12]|uniref:PrsW family intramembrane metalloprotease n=1 Tax=Brachybacterium sp. AOP25-B2-12 TaxID=3457710 RepID=UPI00403411E8